MGRHVKARREAATKAQNTNTGPKTDYSLKQGAMIAINLKTKKTATVSSDPSGTGVPVLPPPQLQQPQAAQSSSTNAAPSGWVQF